jgi:hypothetical protein
MEETGNTSRSLSLFHISYFSLIPAPGTVNCPDWTLLSKTPTPVWVIELVCIYFLHSNTRVSIHFGTLVFRINNYNFVSYNVIQI